MPFVWSFVWGLATLLAGDRATVGVYGAWGAFRQGQPARCYAITAPIRARSDGFASVAARFGRTGRPAIYIRLSRPRAQAAPVTLSIGDRRFTLSGNAGAAWAPDAATDRAIISAMRGGRSMSISAVSLRGRPFADSYALGGAATAIDAATLECRPR
ncbi:invasion associated locus B family protein [Sphingomonas sp. CCH5-D11]|uniref:invasion associated locus B family protein n=1 Tax=Sphingomonas sp. CCH5-D11 TaxID=1768786 RepID=UPI000834FC65|nr:invasion associated locus B family protein [Sphingomonas sp. CCH5-D11]